ncbi:unannotated protein [freshwater metagenome]|uniref:Unannotated protein n=1 Tax=freshwater metagenome TaxID=449393 RepID=A0A6J6MMK6_9ZZZZ|nr:TlyA family rRNA (cytidine-2'-O)-methyltransferase [Actinomycetota bacterium]
MVLRRLDAELTRRGLARSRDHARLLITEGNVLVRGTVALKPATQVDSDASIVVNDVDEGAHYVSRGAHKLIGALDAFPDFKVAGRDGLDAGASTGGFTQVLLERGITRVLAVDVGYGQLAWPLRGDPRVHLMERTNVRTLGAEKLPWLASVVVADLSFISLEVVLPALVACSAPTADYLVMVKPQFEVGKEAVGAGVVRDPELRVGAVRSVALAATRLGLRVRGVVASPLPGPAGNVEYFLWLEQVEPGDRDNGDNGLSAAALDVAISTAVEEGPA